MRHIFCFFETRLLFCETINTETRYNTPMMDKLTNRMATHAQKDSTKWENLCKVMKIGTVCAASSTIDFCLHMVNE